jgi:hypothetical protein
MNFLKIFTNISNEIIFSSDRTELNKLAIHDIQISFIKFDSNEIIDLQHFRQLLKFQTKFVTIRHNNNEIGLFTFSFYLNEQFLYTLKMVCFSLK